MTKSRERADDSERDHDGPAGTTQQNSY